MDGNVKSDSETKRRETNRTKKNNKMLCDAYRLTNHHLAVMPFSIKYQNQLNFPFAELCSYFSIANNGNMIKMYIDAIDANSYIHRY